MGLKVNAISVVCSSLAIAASVACGNASDGVAHGGTGSTGAASAGANAAGGSGASYTGDAGSASIAGSSSVAGSGGSMIAGRAGSGGVAGDTAAGHGGASGGSSASGRAGADAAGSTSVGGSVGMAGGESVFDTSVAVPSHDCRTDTSNNCVSVAGTCGTSSIDVFCNPDHDVSPSIVDGKWIIGCDHLMPGFARLGIPIRPPGDFYEQTSNGASPSTALEFATVAGTVAMFAPNLLSTEVAGSIVAGLVHNRTVSGTFHGKWGVPDADCKSLSGTPCVEANLNLTFRLSTSFGYCFSNDACVAPQTCNLAVFSCTN